MKMSEKNRKNVEKEGEKSGEKSGKSVEKYKNNHEKYI